MHARYISATTDGEDDWDGQVWDQAIYDKNDDDVDSPVILCTDPDLAAHIIKLLNAHPYEE